jgi:xanthine/CO dehydrogenase XdhC/CoxF family maturation factor
MSSATALPPLRAAAPRDPGAAAQHVLVVEFVSRDGRSWTVIGGGWTVEAAIASARESCPDGTAWNVSGWNDLYGD